MVLPIARASSTTEVVASILPAESPVAPLFGTTLTATDIARLPNQRLQARESLPLLPSVIRGTDGLLRLSGARPNDSPMLLDGFDVTDPATGVTSITLAYEVVQGAEVLRDPMNVTYGDLMGALFKLETKPGPDHLTGLQGFVPRPRFQNPGIRADRGHFSALRHGAGDRIRPRPLVRRRRVQLRAHRRAGSHAGQRAEHRREERQRVRARRHRAQQPASHDAPRPDLSQRHGCAGAQPAPQTRRRRPM